MTEGYSPSPENVQPLEWAEKVDNPTILLPGAMGTTDSNEGMRQTLVRIIGEESVLVHPSEWSTDPKSQREKYEAAQVALALKKDKPVRLVAHSMGAVSLTNLLERINNENPEIFADPEKLKLLNIILISPAGFFEPGKASIEFMKRVQEFSSTQANVRIEAAAVNTAEIALGTFVDSLASYPIEGLDLQALVDLVHTPTSPESATPEHVQRVNFSPLPGYRQPDLAPADADRLQKIDQLITQLFTGEVLSPEKADQLVNGLRVLATERNSLLQPYIVKAYDGTPPVTPERTAKQKKITEVINLIHAIPTMVDMMKGKTLPMVQELKDKATITFIVPDRDLIVPIHEFGDKNLMDNVKALLKGYTHASWITGGSQVPGGDMETALRAAMNIPAQKTAEPAPAT